MTDNSVFDEHQDMQTTLTLITKLRSSYDEELRNPGIMMDPDERRRRSRLSVQWPDTDLMRQIILDVSKIMTAYNIIPKNVKW